MSRANAAPNVASTGELTPEQKPKPKSQPGSKPRTPQETGQSHGPVIVSDAAQLRGLYQAGEPVAFVPTMGALHEGHLSLVRLAKEYAEQVVVSVFVNPAQFGPGEDYDKYPRSLDEDVAALAKLGVTAVFVPPVNVMYPSFPRAPKITVDPGMQARQLEGAVRPGHFAGVCQVVAKLFNLVRPQFAIFGQKDAQQLAIVRQMTADLNFPVEIISAPIVRDRDGLALSSRNVYLNSGERQAALALSRGLRNAGQVAELGGTAQAVVQTAWKEMSETPAVLPQYAALVRAEDFTPVLTITPAGTTIEEEPGSKFLLLVAAQVGPARLIDNTEVELNYATTS